ncbi:MAG: ABC transporter ATP-binding protein [Acidaminococcales bacterium]|nr:ABC transporter ATP-binding protein [Acidaminococcales bacterium]
MDKSLLVADNVSVRLGKATILADFSFALNKGEFWGVLGPNGSGKTTFLKTLGGWLPCCKGAVFWEGRPLADMERKAVARRIGMVAVEEGNNSFTVEETIFMGRFAHLGRFARVEADDKGKVEEAMRSVGISDKRGRFMHQLSQGERQKVWVARALAQDVDVLLLDEPTAHLDVKSQSEVFSILENLCVSAGLAVVAILHDVNLALCFSSHLLLIQNRKVKAAGRKENILDAEKFTELYQLPFTLQQSGASCWAKINYK